MEGRILKLPLDKGNKLKEGSWKVYQAGEDSVFWEGGLKTKDKKEYVKEN